VPTGVTPALFALNDHFSGLKPQGRRDRADLRSSFSAGTVHGE